MMMNFQANLKKQIAEFKKKAEFKQMNLRQISRPSFEREIH